MERLKRDAGKTGKTGRLLKRVAGDSIWSIAGLTLMNLTAQFAIYPLWNRQLGNEKYGRILFLIAAMNILAVSMGSACNYGRMKESTGGKTGNRIYRNILTATSLAGILYIAAVCLLAGQDVTLTEGILLAVLTVATLWRYYADVGYRLSLDYKRFFFYYLTISIGYGIGALLFLKTGLWPLALLPGEILGVALVYFRGTVLRGEGEHEPEPAGQKALIRVVLTLFLTEVISNLIFNGDRVLLNLLEDGEAVSLYYQASLLGKTMSLIATPMNSVLIGYLSRYGGRLDRKIMGLVTGAAAGGLAAATVACTLASHILIRLLYPQNYELVRQYFWQANCAQAAFFLSNIAATVLLRYCRVRYQMYINIVYAALFMALCIPGTLLRGLPGFCLALLGVCVLKLGFVLALGWRTAITGKGMAAEAGSIG